MSPLKCSMIKDLHDGTDHWAITGNTIQASVMNKSLFNQYRQNPIEGQVCFVKTFLVSANSNQYRPTNHPFKITFSQQTYVRDHVADLPHYAYKFFPISEIIQRSENEPLEHLTDVISFVSAIGPLEEYRIVNETKHKWKISIVDNQGNAVDCILYDECATNAYQSHLENPQIPTVALLNLCRIGFSEEGKAQDSSFLIMAEIIKLETRHGWTYEGCGRCATKPRLENGKQMCTSCKKQPDSIESKLKVHYIAADDSGKVSLVFWDKLAYQLLQKNAPELKLELLHEERAYDFPDILDDIVGKKLLMKLKLNQYNKDYPNSSISVIQYYECQDLMEEFNGAAAIDPDGASPSAGIDHTNLKEPINVEVANDKHEDHVPTSQALDINSETQHLDDMPITQIIPLGTSRGKRKNAGKKSDCYVYKVKNASEGSSNGSIVKPMKTIKQEKN
ncbi:uncharacterized protein LOC129317387 [Prosopis cineraria]|uniref:uncharacterized protein LOC129317387 n=1 Tax=Prosopis cineraria TaxID=364024 RepID=UPI00240FB763|nr:uncharacterized protein LOC129317387 [Prosopis cineraria]